MNRNSLRLALCAGLLGCLVAPLAITQNAQQLDISFFEWNDLYGPRPNGQVYARFASNLGQNFTVDAVLYRGSKIAGTAVELLRKPVRG